MKEETGTKKAAPNGGGHCGADFVNGQTWEIIKTRVFPWLEEIARQEFGCILGDCDVKDEDLQEIEAQTELIKRCLCSYIDGLSAQYQIYGAKFFGDVSLEKEVYTKLCRNTK